MREALIDALGMEGLDAHLSSYVEDRRAELAAERRAMRERMEPREGARGAGWLEGIDELQAGSFDLLAVAVLYPAPA